MSDNKALVTSESGLIQTETALPRKQVEALIAIFDPYVRQIDALAKEALQIEVTSEDDEAGMKEAREKRLALRKLRTEAEAHRKEQKAFSLETGRLVDDVAKLAKTPAEQAEAHLLEQEKFAERMEEARKAKLKAEREEAISPFIEPGASFPGLAEMDELTFQGLKVSLEDGYKARIEREKREAEEARRREEEEAKERLRLQEVAKREQKMQAQIDEANRAKLEAERKAKQAEEEAEQAREEAKQLDEMLAEKEAAPVNSETVTFLIIDSGDPSVELPGNEWALTMPVEDHAEMCSAGIQDMFKARLHTFALEFMPIDGKLTIEVK